MVLSHEEMKKIFENHGFSGFELRHYDDNMEKLLSFAAQDNAKGYVIDVVPGGLQHGENEGIALMEKHYAKPERFRKLCEKWTEIILYFMCYHPLESVFVSGMTLPDDEDFLEKTPEQEGYLLEFPLESIDDLEEFVDRVFQKTYGEMTFWFASLDMAFHYFRDDVYLIVTLKKITEENRAALGLLKKIVEAKGLFLL